MALTPIDERDIIDDPNSHNKSNKGLMVLLSHELNTPSRIHCAKKLLNLMKMTCCNIESLLFKS
jgi:hypothetical protein